MEPCKAYNKKANLKKNADVSRWEMGLGNALKHE